MPNGTTDREAAPREPSVEVPPSSPPDDVLVGSTDERSDDPDALIEGNRVAVAEDME